MYSFLYIWYITDEHIEKSANAVTSFKNTKQLQNQETIYWHTYSCSLKILGFYQVVNFWCFKIVSRYISRKPFISRNPSKLRSLCQIKRPLHIIFSHGVNYYFDMIFRLVIYPTFRCFCGFALQDKFLESTETFKT